MHDLLVIPAADMATPVYVVFGFVIVQMVHILNLYVVRMKTVTFYEQMLLQLCGMD